MMSSNDRKRPASEIIDLTNVVDSKDDDKEDDRKQAAIATPKYQKVKHEGSVLPPEVVTPEFEKDGLEIVDQPPVVLPIATGVASPLASATDGDEEIQIVGGMNIVNLPHSRQHCTHCKFDPTRFDGRLLYKRETIDKNKEVCSQCYCYVCDKPAKECQSWFSDTLLHFASNHCCAVDTVVHWKNYRKNMKLPSTSGNVNTNQTRSHQGSDSLRVTVGSTGGSTSRSHPGVPQAAARFPAIDASIPSDSKIHVMPAAIAAATSQRGTNPQVLTCQRCEHQFPMFDCYRRKILYCTRCGRLADDSSLKEKATKQPSLKKRDSHHHLLDRRVFNFSLQTPDPRSMDPYRAYWETVDATSPQRQFSEDDLAYEAFQLEIGPRPRCQAIVQSLACGAFQPEPPNDERLFELAMLQGPERPKGHRSTITGLGTINRDILRVLAECSGIEADIAASWNEREGEGVSCCCCCSTSRRLIFH